MLSETPSGIRCHDGASDCAVMVQVMVQVMVIDGVALMVIDGGAAMVIDAALMLH